MLLCSRQFYPCRLVCLCCVIPVARDACVHAHVGGETLPFDPVVLATFGRVGNGKRPRCWCTAVVLWVVEYQGRKALDWSPKSVVW